MCKKVYCKNCKHGSFLFSETTSCMYPSVYIQEFTGLKHEHYFFKDSLGRNLNGDCKYYKHKWWKFWVK